MSIYYVDLELDSNPGFEENNPDKPMGWAEFKDFSVPDATEIIHEMRIKGFRKDKDATKNISGLSLVKWEKYETWGLIIKSFGESDEAQGLCAIEGAGISCEGLKIKSNLKVSQSQVSCKKLDVADSDSILLKLSTLYVSDEISGAKSFTSFRGDLRIPEDSTIKCSVSGKFLDTSFNVSDEGDWGAATFRNCLFNQDIPDPFFVETDDQDPEEEV